ncbi:MAG TPA: putative Ig domain-containing protein, partial [Rhizobium sp.]|nr:putative Ig domain-containing protein [Rhizobium sp.]
MSASGSHTASSGDTYFALEINAFYLNAGHSTSVTMTATCSEPSPVTITLSPAAGALTAGEVGTAYSQTFTASGGTAPYTYAVTAGTLPDGLSLATDGALTGTPTTAGTANFTITATDANSD